MIISRTPLRVSFFGGGTDYPVWYEENGGAVLSTTIDKFCYISCRYLPPFFDHKHRVVYSRIENVKEIAEIKHPAVRAILDFFGIEEGLEIHHDADLPARSGLGSSSSFTVGMLAALYALKGVMPTKFRLANEAIHVERDVLREHVGSQDQIAAAYGGLNKISFDKDGTYQVEPIVLPSRRLKELKNHLMLFFTGFSRFASKVAKKQIKNTPKKQSELLTMYKFVDDAIDILTSRKALADFGRLLHESWKLKRSITDKISSPEIDEIYAAARSAGALGGKILGAGGGGFMLVFAKPEQQAKVRKKLSNLLEVKFDFDKTGSQIIFHRDPGMM